MGTPIIGFLCFSEGFHMPLYLWNRRLLFKQSMSKPCYVQNNTKKWQEPLAKTDTWKMFPPHLDRWNGPLGGEGSWSLGLLCHAGLLVSEPLLVDCQRFFPLQKVRPKAWQTLSKRQQSDGWFTKTGHLSWHLQENLHLLDYEALTWFCWSFRSNKWREASHC